MCGVGEVPECVVDERTEDEGDGEEDRSEEVGGEVEG